MSTISPEVRAAVAAFLHECQDEAQPFAVAEALGAIRAIFPDLEISDSDLEDALSSEAAVAGFEIEYDAYRRLAKVRRKALERRENEGGAVETKPLSDDQSGIYNNSDGTRRRVEQMKAKNQLF